MIRSRMATFIAVAFLVAAVVAGVPSAAQAEVPPDYPIKSGHFFTQSYQEQSENRYGYSVTNDDGIPFWDAYQAYGGVDTLGYPISQRFFWDGQVCQVTQKAVLQWNASACQVQLVNVADQLSRLGKDEWLEQAKRVPRPSAQLRELGLPASEMTKAHMALIEDAPITRSFYKASTTTQAVLGLPTSRVEEYDSCFVVRFQRGVVYLWKQNEGAFRRGQITIAPIGEIAREAGIFDGSIFVPEYRSPDQDAAAREARAVTSRGEGRLLYGMATWYGADFQGSPMRNGEPYNMYDPTTAACNIFPLESKLRVTCTGTGISTIVRVTDTGAFGYPILVDLSWAAFNQIADPYAGTVQITVERVE